LYSRRARASSRVMSSHGRFTQCKKGHQGSGPREEQESRSTPSALYQHSGHIGTFGRTPQVPVALHCKCTAEHERFNPQRLITGFYVWHTPLRAARMASGGLRYPSNMRGVEQCWRLKAKPDGYSDGLCRAYAHHAPAHRAVCRDPLLRHHHHCHIHIE
jgi:hypothetical protein